MKKTKRIISLLVCLAMMLSSIPAFAAYNFDDGVLIGGTAEANMPTISTVYMTRTVDEGTGDETWSEGGIPDTFNAGDEFYVALKVSNFAKYASMANGLSSMTATLVYNTTYFDGYELYGTSTTHRTFTSANGLKTINARLTDNFPGSYLNYDDGAGVYSLSAAAINSSSYSETDRNNMGVPADAALSGVQLTVKGNKSEYPDLSAYPIDTDYIAILHFEVKSGVTLPEEEKVFAVSRRGADAAITLGDGRQFTYNNDTMDWAPYVKIDESGADVFPKSYTVNYYSGGTEEANLKHTESNLVTSSKLDLTTAEGKLTSPDTDGKFFMGWYPESDFSGDKVTADTKVSDLLSGDETTINLYAKWEQGWPIKFYDDKENVGDDTDHLLATKYVKPETGSKLAKDDFPTKPTKTGYGFDEWQYNSGTDTTFDETVEITSSGVDAWATWSEKVKVTLDLNYPGADPKVEEEIDPDTKFPSDKIPDTTTKKPDGYKFKEWNTKANGSGTTIDLNTATFNSTTDNDLYAIWEPNGTEPTVKINFNKNNTDASGATEAAPTSITINVGDKITAMPTDPTRTNYKLKTDKWNTKANGTGVVVDTTTAIDETTLGTGALKEITSTDPKSYEIDVYAQWEVDDTKVDASNKATVTFNKNTGETEADPTSITVVKGDPVGALPEEPTKTDNIFTGWNTQADGTGTAFDATTEVTDDIEVFAQWEAYSIIKYDTNGGAPSIADVKNKPDTAYADPAAVTKAGYTFKEWNTKANGSGTAIAAGETYKTLKDVVTKYNTDNSTTGTEATLYAIWVPDGTKPTVKINFNRNNTDAADYTEAAPTSITINVGDKITAMPTDPTRAKYKLKTDKWNTKANGTGVAVDTTTAINDATLGTGALKEITPATDPKSYEIDVYAQWEVDGTKVDAGDMVTVTFDKDNTTEGSTEANPKTITVVKNDPVVTLPDAPTRPGYTFEGWFTDHNGAGTEFKADTAVDATKTVYAKWTENVTVKYELNGATSAEIEDVKGKKTDTYSDPTKPERTDYTFLGWNTKQNGSGTYIKAVTQDTYEKVLTAAGSDADGSVVTLYAQWGALPNSAEGGGDPGKADPSADGVRVRFDSNAGTDTSATKANPEYKYPKDGESIGVGNMPEAPTRNNYELASWNTKANGSGTTITGAEAMSKSMIEEGKDEIVLYAQWKVKADKADDKITVNYVKNTTATGSTDPKPASQEYFAGDKVIYLPDAPTNGTFTFKGWNTKADGSGTDIEVGTTINTSVDGYVTATQTITAYAIWEKLLKFEIDGDNPEYDGTKKTPTIKIYELVWDETADEGAGGYVKSTEVTSDYAGKYTIEYLDDEDKKVDPINAATYELVIELDPDLVAQGIEVQEQDDFTIDPKKLAFKVEDQEAKAQGDKAADPLKVTVTTTGEESFSGFNVEYYLWDPADPSDKEIAEDELTETDEADLKTVGKYVAVISITDSNYAVGTVTGSTYPDAASGDAIYYPAGELGTNIKYEIVPNDPKAKGISITSPAGTKFYKSDYKTEKPFVVDYDESDTSTDKDEYWVILPKDTATADIKIEAEKYFGIKFAGTDVAEADRAADGSVTKTTSALKDVKTLKADEDATSTTNDIEIVLSNSSGDDRTYTFHILVAVDPELVLGYGNSPYGAIMRDDSITDKDKAKEEFSKTHRFAASYLPKNWVTKFTYQVQAWGTGANLDEDENAYFIYQFKPFKDTGFVAYDKKNDVIDLTADGVSVSIVAKNIQRMKVADMTDLDSSSGDVTLTKALDGTISDLTAEGKKLIRPGIYEIEYTVTGASEEPIKATRKIVVLAKRGDVNLDDDVNSNDETIIREDYQEIASAVPSGLLKEVADIYKYRILDVNLDADINSNDETLVRENYQETETEPLINFYVPIS